jgi:calcineurin-like phosphoesterase family protein
VKSAEKDSVRKTNLRKNVPSAIKNMNKIYISTDFHLGHANMIRYCGRPENHSEIILDNLGKIMAPGDTLIFLGDICMGKDEYWNAKLMTELNFVKKILVRGNHDKKSDGWYLSHGWNFVCESFSDHYFGKFVTFSHEPIPNIQNLNIHGHFHNNLERLKRKDWIVPGEEERNREALGGLNDNHKLLAIEYTDYKPVLLDSFIKKLK